MRPFDKDILPDEAFAFSLLTHRLEALNEEVDSDYDAGLHLLDPQKRFYAVYVNFKASNAINAASELSHVVYSPRKNHGVSLVGLAEIFAITSSPYGHYLSILRLAPLKSR
ncbi:hypothetical protein Trydic_g9272 [Trypoxylus dichotomus]